MIPESVKEETTPKGQGVIAIREEESEDYEEAFSKRAARRSLRVQRRLEGGEPRS